MNASRITFANMDHVCSAELASMAVTAFKEEYINTLPGCADIFSVVDEMVVVKALAKNALENALCLNLKYHGVEIVNAKDELAEEILKLMEEKDRNKKSNLINGRSSIEVLAGIGLVLNYINMYSDVHTFLLSLQNEFGRKDRGFNMYSIHNVGSSLYIEILGDYRILEWERLHPSDD